ncbi:hypothetical protein FJR48_00585 [Sulfurimonas lithotrophica]|uniref:Uncharacterized protein n=1 Tax=Sulfurimonas lithotrophica TaxID=2590022 RepID=A0A5P8NXZ3_9BACT|nr:hypothetical protein [Sulfurimonas lithotrophica]QFR48298.1 hypothetical protein FJR48_00585 [Sulfurimonas lithotrophica]
MSYASWFEEHAQKHKKIVDKLLSKGFSKEQIIEYFEFENMVEMEKDFCPLYAENKKCHDIEELNCYLCACPNFRFDDKGIEKIENKTKYSYCSIDSKKGELSTYGDAMHQNCSGCDVPHIKKYIEDKFDVDWKKIMKDCNLMGIIKTKK